MIFWFVMLVICGLNNLNEIALLILGIWFFICIFHFSELPFIHTVSVGVDTCSGLSVFSYVQWVWILADPWYLICHVSYLMVLWSVETLGELCCWEFYILHKHELVLFVDYPKKRLTNSNLFHMIANCKRNQFIQRDEVCSGYCRLEKIKLFKSSFPFTWVCTPWGWGDMCL